MYFSTKEIISFVFVSKTFELCPGSELRRKTTFVYLFSQLNSSSYCMCRPSSERVSLHAGDERGDRRGVGAVHRGMRGGGGAAPAVLKERRPQEAPQAGPEDPQRLW